jgi:phosphoglycolate phosphatase
MKYKLVIFDFDGTLANTLPWVLTIVDDVADKYKIPRFDRRQMDEVRRLDAKTLLKRYKVPRWKLPLIGRYLHRLLAKNIHKISLFEGVDAMLQQLVEAGVTLAIVSSNSRENIRRVLGPANVARIRYFECGASLFGKHAKLKKVLKRAGVRPSEVLVIGDELRDSDAARRAHLPFGAVAWGYTDFEALRACAPREAFHDVDDIVRRVLAPGAAPAKAKGS